MTQPAPSAAIAARPLPTHDTVPQFPFCALQGQDALKTALLLAAVDTLIGGVLIQGPRGVAKTTSARALAALLPADDDDGHDAARTAPFINLPLGCTQEQLTGTLDLQAALQTSQLRFRPGLLARAHGGVLYVDEVNLLADDLVDVLLDVCASGVNRVERDGISHQHPARITLLGTMNPEEGQLRPQLLDRFGLCVHLPNVPDAHVRAAIVRSRLAFDAAPRAFTARFAAQQAALMQRIARARSIVESASASEWDDTLIAHASALCHASGAEGVRADLVLLRAARAYAALHGRDRPGIADVQAVLPLVLAHRGAGAQDGPPPHSSAPPSSVRPGPACSPSPQTNRQPDTPPSHNALHTAFTAVNTENAAQETGSSAADGDWGALPAVASASMPGAAAHTRGHDALTNSGSGQDPDAPTGTATYTLQGVSEAPLTPLAASTPWGMARPSAPPFPGGIPPKKA